ncbi:protein FAM47E isoform 1-T5 [Spinachia spinachia]
MESETTRPLVPRYKEKLQSKYLKASANRMSSVSICRFVTVSLSLGDEGGVSPVVFHDTPEPKCTTSRQKPEKGLCKARACFSKEMTRKQIRREYVAAVEKKLQQHPLAAFPHYKDHMTPELFDEVVSVLDPDLRENRGAALPTTTGDRVEEENEEGNRAKHVNPADKMQLKC